MVRRIPIDEMIILSISDIHGNLGPIEPLVPWLEAADVVVLAGDITNFGHANDAKRIVEGLRSHSSRLAAVSGNCDYPDVAGALDQMGISLEAGPITVDGVHLLGLGGSLSGPTRTPNVFTEEELASNLDRVAADLPPDEPWLFVSHQPPKDTAADLTSGGQHVGSKAVRDFILAHQPLACFTAHIHESQGVSRLGATTVINPGPLDRGSVAVAHLDGHLLLTCDIQSLG